MAHGADFAIAAKANPALWRVERAVPEAAECPYAPGGWPEGTRTVVRRVRLDAADVRTDPRSRRRRTLEPVQLAMVLAGTADHAYAYNFVVTNLEGDAVEVEAWFRGRARVEERIRDAKAGLALRHLPSGYAAVNACWAWAALLGLNLSAWAQALGRTDDEERAHGKRLRRELLCLPARVIRHARRTVVRLGPVDHRGPFPAAWTALRALPTAGP